MKGECDGCLVDGLEIHWSAGGALLCSGCGSPETLLYTRIMLCDLLLGRRMRARAAELFDAALKLEKDLRAAEFLTMREFERLAVTRVLEHAAHAEWIAGITERGQVLWGGGRRNRCGSPDDPPRKPYEPPAIESTTPFETLGDPPCREEITS